MRSMVVSLWGMQRPNLRNLTAACRRTKHDKAPQSVHIGGLPCRQAITPAILGESLFGTNLSLNAILLCFGVKRV
jgi:hypothetical protein